MSEALEQEIRTLRSLFWSDRDPDGRGFAPLVDAYRRAGDAKQAFELLRDGLSRHPDFATGHVVAARLFLDKGLVEEGELAARTALELDSDNVDALRSLARALDERQATAEAIEVRSRLEALEPTGAAEVDPVASAEAPVVEEPPAPTEIAETMWEPEPWSEPEADAPEAEALPSSGHEVEEVAEEIGPIPELPGLEVEEGLAELEAFAPEEAEEEVAMDVAAFAAEEEPDEPEAEITAVAPEETEEPSSDIVVSVPEEAEEPIADIAALAPEEAEEPVTDVASLAPDAEEPVTDITALAPEGADEPIVDIGALAPDAAEEPVTDITALAPDDSIEPIADITALAPDAAEEPVTDIAALAPEDAHEPIADVSALAPEEPEEALDIAALAPAEEEPTSEPDVLDIAAFAPSGPDDGGALVGAVAEEPASSLRESIATRTMADLYLEQGFLDRAREIYRHLAREAPEDADLQARVEEVERLTAERSEEEVEAQARDLADSGNHEHEVDTPFAWTEQGVGDFGPEGPAIGEFFEKLLSWQPKREGGDA